MDFLLNIAQFGLQALIIVASLVVLIGFIASLASKNTQDSQLKVKNLNEKLKKHESSIAKKTLNKKALKKIQKEKKKQSKTASPLPNLFVLNFDGDIKASAADQLREEISAILMIAQTTDEVIIRLESPGGMVHGYGFAASQLQRIKDKGLKLTVCVDKVAASGGYMMACLADKIIAAPFAIIGSIGVIASLPNFHKILKKNDVDYLEITAGEYKRTLTPLGEITDQKMNKFKNQIEDIHVLFKNHVQTHRHQVDIEKVSTGEYWYGLQAKDLALVDEIGTSDDFVLKSIKTHKILEIQFSGKKSLKEKIGDSLSHQYENLFQKTMNIIWNSKYL